MLQEIGVENIDQLFESIPKQHRLDKPLSLPEAMDETACRAHLGALSVKNQTFDCVPCFLGCGAYRHTVPAAVDALLSRGEFFTAYTPYQPEVSQGTLQGAFEFQTMMAELTGLDVANASLYDGATACAEAVLMMRRIARRKRPCRVLVSDGVHPEYWETIETFVHGVDDLQVEAVALQEDGRTDAAVLDTKLADDVAGVMVQSPNVLGVVENIPLLAKKTRQHKALFCHTVGELTALGLLNAPGQMGCDLAVGEGLGLTGPVYLGGPGVGFVACREKLKRNLPGRLVGETVDQDGKRGYVLTLATREQHIRREKATSNICTNQALMALAVAIHLSLLGRSGFTRLAQINFSRGQYLRAQLQKKGLLAHPQSPHYNEMAVRVKSGDGFEVADRLLNEHGIAAGVPLQRFRAEWNDLLLVNVTERNNKNQIDALIEALAACAG
jgi:glycine dehydrogenase subunit 1